jgi:hypothetical protein
MKIDRTTFFTLTTAIAAATACVARQPANAPSTPIVLPEVGPPPHASDNASEPSAPTTSDDSQAQSGACLDDGDSDAVNVNCDLLKVGPCPESGFDLRERCLSAATNFAPKVAAAAFTCELHMDIHDVCKMDDHTACLRHALEAACPLHSARNAKLCDVVKVSKCGVSADRCVTFASGLNDKGIDQLDHCVNEGGVPCGQNTFDDCVSFMPQSY